MQRKKTQKVHKGFLFITLFLLGIGLIFFISSALGVYTKNIKLFHAMLFRQVGLGVFGGLISLYFFSKLDYRIWKRFAFAIYILGILITMLTFTPLAFSHGGANRWISLGFISFQPAEILKFSVVLLVAWFFAKFHQEISSYQKGLIAFIGMLIVPIIILALHPDTSNIILIAVASFIIYFVRGAPWKHIFTLALLGILAFSVYAYFNPYILSRFDSFLGKNNDIFGKKFQIEQATTAIGSGKIFGRGIGKSIYKYGSYLPESNSDSIFAIYAEETGFLGSLILIFSYILFLFFGMRIAKRAPSIFAQNLVIGIVSLITLQLFLNIAAMVKIVPLSGMPLLFMSNGGTALFITLTEIGIVLNISRHMRKK